MDSSNTDLYEGADQAMSLLGRSPGDRAEVLSRYPKDQGFPSAVLLKLAIALSEAGRFDEAENLFKQGVFIREEFGTSPNLVLQEVILQKALALSRQGNCQAASASVAALGKPVEGLPFTAEGADRFLNDARTQYLLGRIAGRCGDRDAGHSHLAAAAARQGSRELLFSFLAARQLGTAGNEDWNERFEAALAGAEAYSGSSPGLALYSQGCLLRALGRRVESEQRLRQALLFPDRGLSHHLSRELLSPDEL